MKDSLLHEPFLITDLSVWNRYLEDILDGSGEEKERLLRALIRDTLPDTDVSEIREALKKWPDVEGGALYTKLQSMERWQEDLDHMEELGVLYYEFGQPEKALECFQYASEMRPESIQPVQWMAKVYKDLGHEQESETYRNLTKQMQKTSL